jgi:hypothetical protein
LRYYYYRPDANRFAGAALSKHDDSRVLDLFYSDAAIGPTWEPIRLREIADNPDREGDFPSLSNYHIFPLVSQHAWGALSPIIGDQCELLPAIRPSGAVLFLVHILGTTDCVDLSRSKVKRYSSGQIMQITDYCFNVDVIQGKHIFKLPFDCGAELIVDEVFRRVVEDNHLEGLQFPELPMMQV